VDAEIIRDYDPAWQGAFEAERQRIGARLGPRIEAIEHIGSTSVPGLAAKPLIDLMLAVRPDLLQQCVDELAELGYQRDQSGDFPGRVFLRRLDAHRVTTHHLSLTELGSPYWQDQLAFRNALRADPVLVADYAELKRTLAAKHGRGLAYTRAKTDFIRSALASVGHRPHSGWASER
jgi:GrpB-like predicted nucleotidyltransferase (UPF0157 family)